MVANRSLARARLMAKAIADSGNELMSPWVLGPLASPVSSVVNVFERDRRGVEESDTIVADVTQPSIGVGMELMAAYKARRRIIIVARRGGVTSGMLRHMDAKELVEYDKESEVYSRLLDLLRSPSRTAG